MNEGSPYRCATKHLASILRSVQAGHLPASKRIARVIYARPRIIIRPPAAQCYEIVIVSPVGRKYPSLGHTYLQVIIWEAEIPVMHRCWNFV